MGEVSKQKLKVLDLFSGIGGFALGLDRAGGFETVAFCEIEDFPRKVLTKHWPHIPIHRDVRELKGEDVGPVDVICGGYPCQPFSTASRGRRVAVDLWPEMYRIIQRIKPKYVIAENVARKPQEQAMRNLESLGYRADLRCISAAAAGADHTRDRWWVFAYPDNEGEFSRALDAEMALLPEVCSGLWGATNYARAIRVSDGIPNRSHRLRGLGNAVIPQIPEMIGRAIMAAGNPKDTPND